MSKRYYAVQHGTDYSSENGSTSKREAYKIAREMHREYPGEEIRISLEREDDNYTEDEIVVFAASPVKYKIEFRGKTFVRSGMSAQDAIETLCDQYGWRFRLGMYDADTQGRKWAKGAVDTNGGINYNDSIFAETKD